MEKIKIQVASRDDALACAVIYGYYTYAYVFGAIGTRYVSGIATAIVLALITPPLLRPLERALRETRRE